MDPLTPAREIKTKDLEANAEALAFLLDLLKGKAIKSTIDVRYGLGGWAKEIRKKFPKCKIEGWERDKLTQENAWTDGGVDLKRGEIDVEAKADLVLADFNTVTKLNRGELDNLLKIVETRFLIFTDVCCSKLHLNFSSYGLKRPDLGAYWKSFEVEGYRFLGYAREHYAASTGLYIKKKTRR